MALGYLRVQVSIATGLGKKDYVQNILSDFNYTSLKMNHDLQRYICYATLLGYSDLIHCFKFTNNYPWYY